MYKDPSRLFILSIFPSQFSSAEFSGIKKCKQFVSVDFLENQFS